MRTVFNSRLNVDSIESEVLQFTIVTPVVHKMYVPDPPVIPQPLPLPTHMLQEIVQNIARQQKIVKQRTVGRCYAGIHTHTPSHTLAEHTRRGRKVESITENIGTCRSVSYIS